MMVPAWIVYVLIAAFFIRDAYMQSRPSDYKSGYKQALNDIRDEWNNIAEEGLSNKNFLDSMRRFIQKKSDGM